MDKDEIARFGVSLSKSLLKELDRMVKQGIQKSVAGDRRHGFSIISLSIGRR
jgi:hypothetical protein